MNYVFENYLSEIKNLNHRVAVTKLRTSTHKFPIETGRYKNIPRTQRKCTICDTAMDDARSWSELLSAIISHFGTSILWHIGMTRQCDVQ